MITNFKIYESIEINSNFDDSLTSSIIDELSFIVYKGTKKDGKKSKNYKSIRIKSINCDKTEKIIKNNKQIEYIIDIIMTNKDKLYAKYKSVSGINNFLEKSILIYINDELIMDIDNENYDINILIKKLSKEYKNYLKKEWKLK
jgi:hypothetical protein